MTTPSEQHADAATPPIKRARRLPMPAVVLGLLGGHVLFVVTAITLATGDRSFAVVPGYYQKAVDYDERKAQQAASEALGWRVVLSPAKSASPGGERGVTVAMTDRQGAAVRGASVEVDCYHYADAGRPASLGLVEEAPGQYAGQGRLGREGFWQFEVRARRGEQRYVHAFKQFVWQAEAAR